MMTINDRIKPYILVKDKDDKYWLKIGPVHGWISCLNDYMFFRIDDVEKIAEFIDSVKYDCESTEDLCKLIANTLPKRARPKLPSEWEYPTNPGPEMQPGIEGPSIEEPLPPVTDEEEEEPEEEEVSIVYGENLLINEALYIKLSMSNPYVGRYPHRIMEEGYEEFPQSRPLESLKVENEHTFTKEELLHLCETFFNLIITLHDEEMIDQSNIANSAYKKMMEYFAMGQSDETLQMIRLILETEAFSYTGSQGYTSSCNCQGKAGNAIDALLGNITQGGSALSCYDKYVEAMQMWLTKMLSEIETMYTEWLMTTDYDEDMNIIVVPNSELINALINLLAEFLDLDLDLSFSKKTAIHCNCGDVKDSEEHEKNRKIILDYIQVLKWVLACEIEENTNKIHIYGKRFAELLPKLTFEEN